MSKTSMYAAGCLLMGVFSAATAGCTRDVLLVPQKTAADVEMELDAHLQGRIAQHLARLKSQTEQTQAPTVALR